MAVSRLKLANYPLTPFNQSHTSEIGRKILFLSGEICTLFCKMLLELHQNVFQIRNQEVYTSTEALPQKNPHLGFKSFTNNKNGV